LRSPSRSSDDAPRLEEERGNGSGFPPGEEVDKGGAGGGGGGGSGNSLLLPWVGTGADAVRGVAWAEGTKACLPADEDGAIAPVFRGG